MILSILVTGLTVYVAAMLIPGVEIKNYLYAVIVAVTLAFLNTFLGSFLNLVSLPVTVMTLGLFTFVIDGIVILVAGMILPGFKVNGCLTSIIFAIALSILNPIMHTVFGI